MPQLRIICWNIQDLGTDQVDDGSFLDMIVTVIHESAVDLACILETKADEGNRLAGLLKPKLDAKSGRIWAFHSSPKSGPKSNKPENYVFLWDTAVVTGAAGWKFPAQPPADGFPKKHIECRFPYLGQATVNGKTITLIAFHTCFTASEIVECNQNLATIAECADANVVLMGDFNDKATNGRKAKRGRRSFEDLFQFGTNAPERYACALDEKTSLQTRKNAAGWGDTLAARSEYYDHFFWRSTGGELAGPAGSTLDLLVSLQKGNYLHDLGKAVFNNWANRKNAYAKTPVAIKQRKTQKKPPWVDIRTFLPTDDITTVQLAHEIYFDSISDHLPIRLVINVS